MPPLPDHGALWALKLVAFAVTWVGGTIALALGSIHL